MNMRAVSADVSGVEIDYPDQIHENSQVSFTFRQVPESEFEIKVVFQPDQIIILKTYSHTDEIIAQRVIGWSELI